MNVLQRRFSKIINKQPIRQINFQVKIEASDKLKSFTELHDKAYDDGEKLKQQIS